MDGHALIFAIWNCHKWAFTDSFLGVRDSIRWAIHKNNTWFSEAISGPFLSGVGSPFHGMSSMEPSSVSSMPSFLQSEVSEFPSDDPFTDSNWPSVFSMVSQDPTKTPSTEIKDPSSMPSKVSSMPSENSSVSPSTNIQKPSLPPSFGKTLQPSSLPSTVPTTETKEPSSIPSTISSIPPLLSSVQFPHLQQLQILCHRISLVLCHHS